MLPLQLLSAGSVTVTGLEERWRIEDDICRRKWWPCIFIILTILVSLLSVSCPIQLDPAMLQQVKDGIVPLISIFSPSDGSSYAATVVVSGIVTDFSTESGDGGGLRSVAYTIIPETLPGGIVDIAGDGSFSFSFPTTGFSGPMVIKIVAEDWNGNTEEVSIGLVDGGAFATFFATPGNKQATLVWDDVALAESYSVHNLRYGEVQNDVTSPFDWTGLTNGELYSFQIKATSSEGNDNWSEIQDVIPLSFLTLAPSVVPQYRKILVEWASIPAADEYVVSRSLDPSGPFTTRTITANTEFTDGNVLLDQEYYYRVRPFSQDFIDSDSNGAQPSPIPPERWYIVDTIVLPGSAFAVTIAGDRAYVAAYGSGLEIVDISDPISMSTAGSAVTSRYYQDIAVSGDRAFLVGYSVPYLDMFDLSDPTYPVTSTYWNSAWGKPYAIDVSGNYAYVAAGSGGGLRIFDVSGSGPFGTPIAAAGISSASDVDVSGDFAYVTDTCSGPACGLHIIDILDPTFPEIGLRPLPGMTAGVAVAGGLAYVANGGEGLQIVNATAPYGIEGAQATSGGATHVAVSGDYAYVGGDDGLTVVDISNPTFPIVGTRKIPRDETESYAVWGIAVAGSLVYVAAEEAGLVVIDTLDPTYPIVGSCDTPGWASAVAISGSYAFVADGDTGLQVVDISDPAFPVVGSTPTPGNAEAIVVHGDRVYIGESDFGVQVIDVSIPATPTVIGATAMPVSGRYAYVADANGGLQVIDLLGE